MSRKMHVHAFVAAVIICTLSIGCSRHIKSLFAQGLDAIDQRKDAPTLNKEAYELILKDDYEAAIKKAELAVRKDPNFGEAHKNLALAYCDSGRVEEALAPAQKAVSLAPNLDKAHYVHGKVLFKLERYSEAIIELHKAVRVNPKYDKAYYLIGRAYDLSNKADAAETALDQAIRIKPDNFEYRRIRDFVVAYARQQKNRTTLPAIVPIEGRSKQYAAVVYSGIFFEALIHRNFDLIDRAADQARVSKEKLPGGTWKLQQIYAPLGSPFDATSDYEWNQHLNLLKQWTREKPNSVTAKIALADAYVEFAWKARGYDYADKVSEQNWVLFRERLANARAILTSAYSEQLCPKWYDVMQLVALGQNWDKETYEKMFSEAVAYEPTWYHYYKNKSVFLLPQWNGETGELEAYVNSLAVRPGKSDNAILYFLVNEYVGANFEKEKFQPATHYPVLKQGFVDLRKTYGVTPRNVNWACYRAIQSNDRSFASELFSELKNDADLRIWGTQQAFDGAKTFAELK